MILKQRSRPNPSAVPSYPPTLHIPLPLPSKTLDPSQGSRVMEGKGQGQPFLTPGLPPLITNDDNTFGFFFHSTNVLTETTTTRHDTQAITFTVYFMMLSIVVVIVLLVIIPI